MDERRTTTLLDITQAWEVQAGGTPCGPTTNQAGMNRCRRMLKNLEEFGLEVVEGRDLENE